MSTKSDKITAAYDALMAYQHDTEALFHIAERLMWDQETVMPRGAADQRSEERASIESVIHARRSSPKLGDWLAQIEDSALDHVGQANLRLIRRNYERAERMPAALVNELARVTSRAQGLWAEARADEDMAAFVPILEQVVALKREEAQTLANGGDPYDALLDDYEPGASAADLDEMFSALRPSLVRLRSAALEAEAPPALDAQFDESKQMKLSRQLAKTFGYDMSRGRVDKAVHPFASGMGADVRITTRTSPKDPFNSIYSTIHEVGHACYEQGISSDYTLTPLGMGVSMGVHESQSRIYENQLGRSRGFTSYLFGEMRDVFGDFGVADEDTFYRIVNRLHKGFIRTESDEIQYNLHVMLRFDLERQMISGDLAPADLEEAWNARFLQDFGYPVDKPSNGCLQDVHWSVGLFGYFPTYTLGNVYAGCLHEALREAVPDLDAQLALGDLEAATGWLRENLQQHGSLYTPRDVVERACGKAPSEVPLLRYLERKFGALYGI